jgi:Family of unknown function (DUF6441)
MRALLDEETTRLEKYALENFSAMLAQPLHLLRVEPLTKLVPIPRLDREGARMKLAASLTRSLQADMRVELRELERAVATGAREAGRGLKTEIRRQVASAGLGQRLANSWRDKHYPNRKLDAASLVYTRVPQIVRAFDEGVPIRSKRGRFLAIPTENAPRKTSELRSFRHAIEWTGGRAKA